MCFNGCTMLMAALFALAVPSPAGKADVDVDKACLLVMADAGRLEVDDPDGKPIGDSRGKDAMLSVLQFFLGRLSALDPHTDWVKIVATRAKHADVEQTLKLAPACIARKSDLSFGDDAGTLLEGH